jgi:hypothetical protein
VRRLVAALLFLMLVNEGDPTSTYPRAAPEGFASFAFAPFGWVQSILFDPLPIKVRPFDLVMLVILVLASSKAAGKARKVAPMRSALLLAVATVVVWFVYGIATGGDARAASWQVYLLLASILAAFTIATVFVTHAHYELLAKTVIAAGVYRAVMCWIYYFGFVWGHGPPAHEYITAHDDSVVWVISIIAVARYALSKRSTWTTVRALVLSVLLLGAIQWNNRRLAWVSLVMGLVVAFFLLPRSKVRQRVVRMVMIAAPIVGIYVAVGWGRTERIFAPLASLASVSTQEDQSTKARNVENLGLIETVHQAGAFAGTGWGHPYVEVSNKYSIARFMELWQYVPHNSILGLLAYTGMLGFAGYWLPFPTAVFLNSRIAKMAVEEPIRNVGFVSSTAMIVCASQMYGDMGAFSLRTMYLLATCYAVALRMPLVAKVWGLPQRKGAPPPPKLAEPAT